MKLTLALILLAVMALTGCATMQSAQSRLDDAIAAAQRDVDIFQTLVDVARAEFEAWQQANPNPEPGTLAARASEYYAKLEPLLDKLEELHAKVDALKAKRDALLAASPGAR